MAGTRGRVSRRRSLTENPAARIESRVARLHSQPWPTIQFSQCMRSCHRRRPDSSEATCLVTSSRPPGARIRRSWRRARAGSRALAASSLDAPRS